MWGGYYKLEKTIQGDGKGSYHGSSISKETL